MTKPPSDRLSEFRSLFPHVPEAELQGAHDRFERFVALAIRMAERIGDNPSVLAEFRSLTDIGTDRTMKAEKVD